MNCAVSSAASQLAPSVPAASGLEWYAPGAPSASPAPVALSAVVPGGAARGSSAAPAKTKASAWRYTSARLVLKPKPVSSARSAASVVLGTKVSVTPAPLTSCGTPPGAGPPGGDVYSPHRSATLVGSVASASAPQPATRKDRAPGWHGTATMPGGTSVG